MQQVLKKKLALYMAVRRKVNFAAVRKKVDFAALRRKNGLYL